MKDLANRRWAAVAAGAVMFLTGCSAGNPESAAPAASEPSVVPTAASSADSPNSAAASSHVNGGDTGDEGASLAPPQTRQNPTVAENQSDTGVSAAQKLPEPMTTDYGGKHTIISMGLIEEIGGKVPSDPLYQYFVATVQVTNPGSRQFLWLGGLESKLIAANSVLSISIDPYTYLNGRSVPGDGAVLPNGGSSKTTALVFQIPKGNWPSSLTVTDGERGGETTFNLASLQPSGG